MSNNPKKTPEQKSYEEKVRQKMPKSRVLLQCIRAFIVGGLICCLGQAIGDVGSMLFVFTEAQRASFTCIVLIFLAALLTGLGVYDKLGRFAGAGSIVPITGFANSIVAPSMEFKREGFITGVGAKLFSIAGPVLVYGISTSVAVGIIYFILYGTV